MRGVREYCKVLLVPGVQTWGAVPIPTSSIPTGTIPTSTIPSPTFDAWSTVTHNYTIGSEFWCSSASSPPQKMAAQKSHFPHNCGQIRYFIANIIRTQKDIVRRKTALQTTINHVGKYMRSSFGELYAQMAENRPTVLTNPKTTFWTILGRYGVIPWKFHKW